MMQTTNKFSNTYSLVELALHLDLKLHLDFEASPENTKIEKEHLMCSFLTSSIFT
ncbi:hypothetical protein VS_1515 [Vibrio atlanticus]|uniref:Uncharacterized protein n=1 Tax=Vibrio atlanticus (strain LGP32) TaxID=575788 RepID=B7VNV2_VIBA3|nr:hypothetical protein VS_1515 [Vibrio atlanticus]